MIPIALRIAGFLSYLEPVEVDFSGFEMACISGANGAGKSSLLDAITWCLFGEARSKDDEAVIHSSPNAKAAEVTFTFAYESNIYRVSRAKPRGKTSVLEFHVQTADGAWRPMTESSLRATEKHITQTLRLDYETFVNASFFLQGKADQFAQKNPAKRKEILASILGLEQWEDYKQRAAERRKGVESELAGVDATLRDKNDELAQEQERRETLKNLEEDLRQSQRSRKDKQDLLDASRRQEEMLKGHLKLVEEQEKRLNEAQLRLDGQKSTLDARKVERDGYQSKVAAAGEIRAAHQRWQLARGEAERWSGLFAQFSRQKSERDQLQAVIDLQRDLLKQEQTSLSASQAENLKEALSLPVIEADLQAVKVLIEGLIIDQARLPDVENERDRLNSTASDLTAHNRQLKSEGEAVSERIARLSEVEEANCPLCGQPLTEQHREDLVVELEAQRAEMRATYSANQEAIQAAEKQRRDLDGEITRLRGLDVEIRKQTASRARLETNLAQSRARVEAWQNNGARRLGEVERQLAEHDFAKAEREQLERLDTQLRRLGYDAAAHEAALQTEQAGRESEAQLRALESAESALQPLGREIAELEKQIEDAEWQIAAQKESTVKARKKYDEDAALLPDLDALEDEVRILQEHENKTRLAVGGAKQKVDVLTQVRKQAQALTREKEELQKQIARLKMLEKAFGKDGVPALLIEEALPEIQAQANDILERLSGGAMNVRFNTQKDYKDKNREGQRETLEIIISDATGERAYELFSGGEAFRINFAIRLALSRVLAQRAGARLQTLVIDEGFGSQDAEGRQRLLEALNLVKPDFAKVLVITHLEDLKDAFPARIEVEKTPSGSRVRVV